MNGLKRSISPPVVVVWNECSQQYSPDGPLWSTAYGITPGQVTIIIDPLDSSVRQGGSPAGPSLYRVRVHNVDGSCGQALGKGHALGPLLDGMVVGGELLGSMVRQTVVAACGRIREVERGEVNKARTGYKRSAGGRTGSGGSAGEVSKCSIRFERGTRGPLFP